MIVVFYGANPTLMRKHVLVSVAYMHPFITWEPRSVNRENFCSNSGAPSCLFMPIMTSLMAEAERFSLRVRSSGIAQIRAPNITITITNGTIAGFSRMREDVDQKQLIFCVISWVMRVSLKSGLKFVLEIKCNRNQKRRRSGIGWLLLCRRPRAWLINLHLCRAVQAWHLKKVQGCWKRCRDTKVRWDSPPTDITKLMPFSTSW